VEFTEPPIIREQLERLRLSVTLNVILRVVDEAVSAYASAGLNRVMFGVDKSRVKFPANVLLKFPAVSLQ
jgi:hypothetical protein